MWCIRKQKQLRKLISMVKDAMVYEFHFGTLAFTLYFNFDIRIAEIKIGIRSLSVPKTFIQGIAFQLSHGIKMIYRSKLYQKHAQWGKDFSQLLYIKRFASRLFSDRVKKLVVYFGLYESSLGLPEKRRPNKYCL